MTMTAPFPLFSLLGLLILQRLSSTNGLAPLSRRGRANRGPLKSTLEQEISQGLLVDATAGAATAAAGAATDDDIFLLNLQEYTARLLSPEIKSISESTAPRDILPVLSAWVGTESLQGTETAQHIFMRLKHDSLDSVTNRHYAIVMEAWGKIGNAQQVNNLFEKMESLALNNPAIAPNRVSYNVCMSALCKAGNIQQASDILSQMEQNEDTGIQPITHDYNVLLGAHARTGKAGQVEQLMKHMIDRCQLQSQTFGSCDCAPDILSYNLLLDAHARSSDANAGNRAQEILSTWQTQYEQGELSFLPDARSYTAVIQAVVRSEIPEEAIAKAKKLLSQSQSQGIKNDIYIHVALLEAYAASRDPKAGEEAETLLDEMEKEGLANSIAYNTVLKMYKISGRPDALARSEALVQRMQDRKIANTISYTTLVGVLANLGTKTSAKRAHDILELMQKAFDKGDAASRPNVNTYNSVMNAWLRCGNVQQAEHLLRQLEQLYKAGDSLAPNVVSYSTVMNGYARSREEDAIQKAEQIFDRMQAAYKAGNKKAQPNMHSYVTLINAYQKSNDPDAAPKAEKALFELYDEYKQGNNELKPNYQLMTTVIDCWQRSGEGDAGEKAEALLEWMISLYQEKEDKDFEPNSYTFSSAITAWSRSRKLGKAFRARAVLQRMIDLHKAGSLSASPNDRCYTAVINSCKFFVSFSRVRYAFAPSNLSLLSHLHLSVTSTL